MLPGSLVHSVPASITWYTRGSQGSGALPVANLVINTPILSTLAWQLNDYVNPADGSKVAQDLVGTAADRQLQRYTGLYYATVSIFQDVDATLQLQERTILNLLDPTGATDQFKTVITRVISANVPYREAFFLMNAEARFQYKNGTSNTTAHDFTVMLRAA